MRFRTFPGVPVSRFLAFEGEDRLLHAEELLTLPFYRLLDRQRPLSDVRQMLE
jgi:hypothetical protein